MRNKEKASKSRVGFASKKFKISKTQEGEDEQLEGQIHDPMVEGNMESAQEEGEKLPEERGIEVNIEQHTGEYGHDQILENESMDHQIQVDDQILVSSEFHGDTDLDSNRRRAPWTAIEKQALLDGYAKYASCYDKWSRIKTDEQFVEVLKLRTNGDLKDKYRNISLAMKKARLKNEGDGEMDHSLPEAEISADYSENRPAEISGIYDGDTSQWSAVKSELDEAERSRRRATWTEAEKQALLDGYLKHGGCHDKWSRIKNDEQFVEILKNRTNGDLKDKYRNITMTAKGRLSLRAAAVAAAEAAAEAAAAARAAAEAEGLVEPMGETSIQIDAGIIDPSADEMDSPRQKVPRIRDTFWSDAEKQALMNGYERYGSSASKWRKIKLDPDFAEILHRRSNADLKDKYRNIQLALFRSRSRNAFLEASQPQGECMLVGEEKPNDMESGEDPSAITLNSIVLVSGGSGESVAAEGLSELKNESEHAHDGTTKKEKGIKRGRKRKLNNSASSEGATEMPHLESEAADAPPVPVPNAAAMKAAAAAAAAAAIPRSAAEVAEGHSLIPPTPRQELLEQLQE